VVNLINWPPGYYLIRDRVPFYMLLLYFTPKRHRKLTDQLTIAPISVILGVTLYLAYNRAAGTPWSSLLSYWNYPAPIEWGIFITATYIRSLDKGGTTAATLSLLAASAGGWLHEIPWFAMQNGVSSIIRVNGHNVFMLSFQILAVPILAALLQRHGHRWTGTAKTCTALYLAYLVTFPIDPIRTLYQNQTFTNWLTRLPTIAMLTAHLEATR